MKAMKNKNQLLKEIQRIQTSPHRTKYQQYAKEILTSPTHEIACKYNKEISPGKILPHIVLSRPAEVSIRREIFKISGYKYIQLCEVVQMCFVDVRKCSLSETTYKKLRGDVTKLLIVTVFKTEFDEKVNNPDCFFEFLAALVKEGHTGLVVDLIESLRKSTGDTNGLSNIAFIKTKENTEERSQNFKFSKLQEV